MNKHKGEARGCAPAEKPASAQFVITRAYKAPRALVFRAWTEGERLRQWWGPKGFAMPFFKTEPRPGGILHYCMRSPEGKDFWGRGVYLEVDAPERLVFADSFSNEKGDLVPPGEYGMGPEWPDETIVTVTFHEKDGGTEVKFDGGVSEALAKQQQADKGWNESFDRLEEYLKREAAE
ncbi:MAG: hypothetical protein A2X32_03375 [Elusimicrobia bacterium GWC2_64_44]|nr:MAG: hypothetical protein A2X32_03375 [Elusimicrobia bacterium GWC2_64_44]